MELRSRQVSPPVAVALIYFKQKSVVAALEVYGEPVGAGHQGPSGVMGGHRLAVDPNRQPVVGAGREQPLARLPDPAPFQEVNDPVLGVFHMLGKVNCVFGNRHQRPFEAGFGFESF